MERFKTFEGKRGVSGRSVRFQEVHLVFFAKLLFYGQEVARVTVQFGMTVAPCDCFSASLTGQDYSNSSESAGQSPSGVKIIIREALRKTHDWKSEFRIRCVLPVICGCYRDFADDARCRNMSSFPIYQIS